MAGPTEENTNSSDERVDDLLLEYNERLDAGERISPEDFITQHDEFREQLSRYFDNVVAVESLAGPRAEEEIEGTVIAGETHDGGFAETMIENSSSGNAARINKDAPLTQFGRYRIRKELGRGAMGAVYLAHDEQLDREVALKIPKFETDENQDLLERFYREARAAAALQHSGICPVFDVGELDGQHYITMAFVKGRPLRDFTKSSKRQKGKQVARVIRKIAIAMAEAHEHNVVHRDLKPANIMINEKNEPVVMDFGLARRAAEGEEQLTHTGTVIGTPAYMSPEQVDGDNENVGPQSDIYSLGVIFYEMLTGQLPFQGNLMSILKQISMKQPRPPVELHSDTDPFLQDLCLKMLEKEAKDRPESMHEVAKALSEWLQGLHAPTDESGMLETSRVPGQSKKKADTVEATAPMTTPGVPRAEPQPEEFPAVEEFPAMVEPAELSATTVTPGRPASVSADQPPTKNRKPLLMAGLGGAALLLAGITFFFTLGGKYDVKITVEDPAISLKVDGEDVLIDGAGSPIRLSAGTHTLQMERDGLEAELKEFTVKKDGKNVVHVAVLDGRLAIAAPESVRQAKPTPGTTSPPVGNANYALQFTPVEEEASPHVIHVPTLEDKTPSLTIETWYRNTDETDRHQVRSHAFLVGFFPIHRLGGSAVGAYDYRVGNAPGGARGLVSVEVKSADRTKNRGTVHLAGVRDASRDEIRFYVNGSLVGRRPLDGAGSSGALRFGSDHSEIGHFGGWIDETRISSVARYDADFIPAKRFGPDEHTLALYHFDEGQGDALKDSSGNDHHGKIVGAEWVQPEDRAETTPVVTQTPPGTFGLNLAECVGEWGATAELNATSLVATVEAWMTAPERRVWSLSRCVGLYGRVENLDVRSHGRLDLLLELHTNRERSWRVYRTHADAAAQYEIGQRAHIAGVVTPSSIELYVNGRKAASRAHDYEKRGPGIFRALGIGLNGGDIEGSVGTIDEFRFSNVVRYTGDFQPPQRFEADDQTVVLYHFDEGQGNILKDSSGNGYHATIHSKAKWVRVGSGEDLVAGSDSESVRWPLEPSRPEDIAWLRELGATITLRTGLDQNVDLTPDDKLPAGQATIVGVKFDPHEPQKVTDDVMQRLGTLTDLEKLELKFTNRVTAVTAAGPSHLASLVNLQHLELAHFCGQAKTDPSFFATLPRLEFLNFSYGARYPWEEGVVRSKSLRQLFLYEALPKNWEPFARMPRLSEVTLMGRDGNGDRGERAEKRQAGARQFAALAPWCRIVVRGFDQDQAKWTIIEPTVPHPHAQPSAKSESATSPSPAVAPFDEKHAKAHQEAWADYLGVPVEKEVELPGGEKMSFVLIPPGEFLMGTTDAEIARLVELVNHPKQPWTVEMVNSEGPRHPVALSEPFYIGKYEVTQDQWQAVSRNNPAKHRGSGDLPVENISWDDTQSFLKSLSSKRASEELQFALPTEEQWEFACRSGTDSLWHFGDDAKLLSQHGWFRHNSDETTHSIGQLQPNAFGLHDVHGNVSEWCNNRYTYSYSEDPAATRPDFGRTSLTNYRTHRGGKFQSQAELVRSAVRAGATPNRQDGGTGFRLVMLIDVSKIKERKPSGESVSSFSPVEVLTSPEFTWTEPVPFFEAVNSDAFEGSPSLSSDGGTLFFTRLGENGRPEGNELLVTTRSSAGEWSTPQRLPGDPGELLGLSEPHFHEESASLYLHTSQLPGKIGASDLYVSHRAPGTSTWSSPESLGPTVNSAAQDQAPTLSADGRVLVFHSDRDGGQGRMDLWISTRESSAAEWSTPINAGSNVNSEQWETHPCLSSDGLVLLFVRRELATNWHRSLWQSVRRDRDSDWEPATEIRLSDNGVRRNVRSPALSADGRTLIFASGSRDGKDDDLMISRRVLR